MAAEFLGDSDLLVIAPSETGKRRLLVSGPIDRRPDWYEVGPDLARLLETFRDSGGDKYWEPPGRSE